MDVCSLLVAVFVCVCVCVCVSSPMRNSPTGAKRMLRCLVLTRELNFASEVTEDCVINIILKIPLAIGNNMSKAFC